MRKKNTHTHTETAPAVTLRDLQQQVETLTALLAAQAENAPADNAPAEVDAIAERLARKAENRRLRAENEQQQCKWTGFTRTEKQCTAKRHRKSGYCKQHKAQARMRNQQARAEQQAARVEKHGAFEQIVKALRTQIPQADNKHAIVCVTPGNESFGVWARKNALATTLYDAECGTTGVKLLLGNVRTKQQAKQAAHDAAAFIRDNADSVDFEIRIIAD